MNTNPWIEKYRPQTFENIVLDEINKKILNGIIDKQYFPNLLFYGPPGTGKTTTIINLIKKYEKIYNEDNKSLVIHLNASDDRGIDIIRNQIFQFVNTNSLFCNGTKFVILDEADYMTKNAQTALRDLIQKYNNNVRFCLICNYISRIDGPLQNEFVKLRFCNLPENEILKYLKNITKAEKIKISIKDLKSIQKLFDSDIRSMVNYIQSNHNINYKKHINIIDDETWNQIINIIISNEHLIAKKKIKAKAESFGQDLHTFIKKFVYYLILKPEYINSDDYFTFFKYIVRNIQANTDWILSYFVLEFRRLYNLS
tara:strand:+ start:1059 stop:1997 length:939 start_codon:yes stop_codon:yes gene_type:complete